LQVGNYVAAHVPVFALVATGNVWIEANFKEDQLAHMKPGQQARITIDSHPGQRFTGRVVSLSPGTGSQFSLLPPENATGNWVKVVQRVPVRIELENADPQLALHAGLSASVDVDTRWQRRLFSAAGYAPVEAVASR
jgi:membrane fusion protein (multidrug efflux system)